MESEKHEVKQKQKDKIRTIVQAHRVIAILRNVPEEDLKAYVACLYEGGIRAFEVSFTTKQAEKQIDFMKQWLPMDTVVGAGTIMTAQDARRAEAGGADFMLSPSVCQEVLDYCAGKGAAYLPGVLTPSDVSLSLAYGFSVLKLFPADVFPINYRKSLQGPFPQTDFVAVGGVSLKNAALYLQNGFAGVGIGSSLIDKNLYQKKKWGLIAADIRAQMENLRKDGLV